MKQAHYRKTNSKSVIIMVLALAVGMVIFGFGVSADAADIYVSLSGTDGPSCGSQQNPCRQIEYAVEQRASSGDTVKVNDGTYEENSISFPSGVSLTSTSQDNTRVKLQPNTYLAANVPFLVLSSVTPGSSGNQTISHIELDGENGFNTCRWAISVQNRDNVRIHHCDIHDFSAGGTGYNVSYAVFVKSTDISATFNWWDYWPDNPQEPGTDTNLNALWPEHPVTNFELDNNTITKCGYRASLDSGSFSPTVRLFNLKDSSIHHNIINSVASKTECINGTSAFLDNVDIHNNDLTMDRFTDRSSYIIEIWNMKGGCEIYNNTANAAFSIAMGKETSIYDNEIIFDPHTAWSVTAFGIEFTLQNWGKIYGNYIEGQNCGIEIGVTDVQNGNFICEGTEVYNNVVYSSRYMAISIDGTVAQGESHSKIVRDMKVYNNTFDGLRTNQSYYGLIYVHHNDGGGSCDWSDIQISNNICTGYNAGYAAKTIGSPGIESPSYNLFYNCGTNDWSGSTDTYTVVADPLFVDQPTGDYHLQSNSPAINAGVDVGLPFAGAAPDLGAFEYATGGDTTAPTGTIIINGGDAVTSSDTVTLTLSATDNVGVTQMAFNNDGGAFSSWETYSTSKSWTLSSGDGTKTVGVKYRDAVENESTEVQDTITLSAEEDIVIDNGDAGTSSTGIWSNSIYPTDYYGTAPKYSNSSEATYMFETSISGTYDVFLHWTEYINRSSNVTVEIYDDNTKIGTEYVNQQENGGQWNLLDSYAFTGTAKVVIISSGGGDVTIADGVKFSLADASESIVDNGDAGTSSTGIWSNSIYPTNYYGTAPKYSNSSEATYTFETSISGTYDVFLHWTEYINRSSNVTVEIYDDNTKISTEYVNQQENGGQWNLLGSYAFTGTAKVVIISSGGGDVTIADGVKFRP